MEKSKNAAAIKQLITNKRQSCIVTHWSPDGDAMGSALGLYAYLKSKGHQVTVLVPNDYPEFLSWLPGNENVLVANTNEQKVVHLLEATDLLFVLDFNAPSRFGPLGDILPTLSAKKILIDHHQQPDDFADLYWHTVEASSTCELIYTLLEEMGDAEAISKDMATCLYTGIMTDTGSFRFPSTSAKTLSIASLLVSKGVDNAEVYNKIHDENTEGRLKLLGYSLSEKMVVMPELNSVYISLTNEELDRFNFKKGDTEGLVNYGLSIKGIRFSTFIVERDGVVKMSFRSKGKFDVNIFAREHFNGGGHKNAAGGVSDIAIEETVNKFIKIIANYKEALNS